MINLYNANKQLKDLSDIVRMDIIEAGIVPGVVAADLVIFKPCALFVKWTLL